jgi:hypothetical protein
MAKRSGLSQTAISRIWRAFALQPHRVETFKLSWDPLFIEKVRDIVGLYLNPPDKALVLCVDEKAQIQALDRSQPVLPMRPGQVERRTHDYTRHGTTTLFAALNAKSGRVISECHRRQRAREFRTFLDTIHARVPPALDVHLILDNSSTHKTAVIHRSSLVGASPAGAPALHADRRLVDQSRRALVRRPHREAVAAGRASQHSGTGDDDPPIRRDHQRPREAVCLDEDRGRDPRKRRPILSSNLQLRTLD